MKNVGKVLTKLGRILTEAEKPEASPDRYFSFRITGNSLSITYSDSSTNEYRDWTYRLSSKQVDQSMDEIADLLERISLVKNDESGDSNV